MPDGPITSKTWPITAVGGTDETTYYSQMVDPQNIQISSARYSNGATPVFQLDFMAEAGQTYTVQYRDSLAIGQWAKLADVQAADTKRMVEISDPDASNSSIRYYRIVSP
jgi:hypothetical protein